MIQSHGKALGSLGGEGVGKADLHQAIGRYGDVCCGGTALDDCQRLACVGVTDATGHNTQARRGVTMVLDGVKRVCSLAVGIGICNLRQAFVDLAVGGK